MNDIFGAFQIIVADYGMAAKAGSASAALRISSKPSAGRLVLSMISRSWLRGLTST